MHGAGREQLQCCCSVAGAPSAPGPHQCADLAPAANAVTQRLPRNPGSLAGLDSLSDRPMARISFSRLIIVSRSMQGEDDARLILAP